MIEKTARKTEGKILVWLFLLPVQAAILFSSLPNCAAQGIPAGPGEEIPVFSYEIVNSYPHDPTAFTQGLAYDRDGVLYEGTGLYGRSSLRRVDLETGRILQQVNLSGSLFGEGIALWGKSIVQLTWQSGLGLVYNQESLTEKGRFGYRTEGWGITCNSSSLIMSDGSNILYILDPATFRESGRINVTMQGKPLPGLNELEFIQGEIYANIWPSSRIAIISPENGAVRGELDLAGILPEDQRKGRVVDVLNGIAYDPAGGRIFVTGKLWPRLYEIRLVAGEVI